MNIQWFKPKSSQVPFEKYTYKNVHKVYII